MIDLYAEERARLEAMLNDVVKPIDDHYRERIERARDRNWPGELSRQLRNRAEDVERATKPLVAAYAKIPAPPVMIKLGDDGSAALMLTVRDYFDETGHA